MNKPLIIVESPTKAKTITKFLGGAYQVEASFGHVRDLPKSKLSIDTEHDFEPTYVIPPKAKEVVDKLKALVKTAPEVILAPDEDREGESIAWHLTKALDLDSKKNQDKKVSRIVFHEITKSAIEHALETPRAIDGKLVDAQQARRVLDRLVGYELSPFLWRKIRYGLSAGRVQSVAVRLVVEREREIDAFKSEEYWSVEAKVSKTGDDKNFTARLVKHNGKAYGKMGISKEADATKIKLELEKQAFVVDSVETKEVRKSPAPPFTTSTLQQEAARKLGFSAKQTMTIAQRLYEEGVITYMRTDSVNLAASSLAQAQEVITAEFGKQYNLATPRSYKNKSKGAQEAHEAIRPTDLSLLPQNFKERGDKGHTKLYELIWKRTIACQMQEAVLDHTSVDISAGPFGLRASGQVIKFDGFIRAYTEGQDEDQQAEDDSPAGEGEETLPELASHDKLDCHEVLAKQHFTEPPPRYTDASLVKALEAHGIGRPSTYAPTLATIQERDYVTKEDKKYKPTEVGFLVTDMLVENFPEIVDINFTSHIEESFDDIAEGKQEWVPVIREFYEPFKKHLTEKEASVEKLVEVSTTICQHCGQPMLIKFGRFGRFLACPDPESKITQPLPEEQAQLDVLAEKTKDERCPICGKTMTVRRGRFGFFLGCSDYPKCKGISKIWNKTGYKCPLCLETESRKDKPGDIVEKKGRGRAKPFWACTRWPDCDLIFNKLPESQAEVDELFLAWKTKPKTEGKKKRSTKKKE